MSQIPPSKRSKSDLKAQSFCYDIRKKITAELMASFGYSEKRMDAHIRKITNYIKDADEKKRRADHLRAMEDDFDMWYIEQERVRILNLTQNISGHIRGANSIWPEYWCEYFERRLEWDRALADCNRLQDELQYIAEVLPADKNKYTRIVLDIEALFKMIKALRQSDNRFKKHLKDQEPCN